MGRKVDLFRGCPPCPPAHHHNAGLPPTPSLTHSPSAQPPPLPCDTDTHINAHTPWPAGPPRNRGGRVGGWVGFPWLFKQIPTDGRGTFLLRSRCSLTQPPLPWTPQSFTSSTTTLSLSTPSSFHQDPGPEALLLHLSPQKHPLANIPFPQVLDQTPTRLPCGSSAELRTLRSKSCPPTFSLLSWNWMRSFAR